MSTVSANLSLVETDQQPVICEIQVARPIDRTYKYFAAAPINRGTIVEVEFGSSKVLGVVIAVSEPHDSKQAIKLKWVAKAYHNLPALPAQHLKFLQQVAQYYAVALGKVVNAALPLPAAAMHSPQVRILQANPDLPPTQHRLQSLWQQILSSDPAAAKVWQQRGFSSYWQQKLISSQHARWQWQEQKIAPAAKLSPQHQQVNLNDEQAQAVQRINQAVTDASAGKHMLLEGVTGSGKTEVYLEAIASCLRQGKQALVLMPEIGLTEAWLQRCRNRFAGNPLVWHSHLTNKQRRTNWVTALRQDFQLVVGARSALFLPFDRLGLIVVDEEHDHSYKNSDTFPYHARDMAILRAQLANAICVLATATPALETLYNVESGRLQHLRLRQQFSKVPMAKIELLDLRQQKQPVGKPPNQGHSAAAANTTANINTNINTNINIKANIKASTEANPRANAGESKRTTLISTALQQAINSSLANGEQCLIFLNRRGFAAMTLCQQCGYRLLCPHCEQALVTHKNTARLLCHLCGYQQPERTTCPKCNAAKLRHFGAGIEQLAEEAELLWPHYRKCLITSDHVKTVSQYKTLLDQISTGEIRIIIGTQMIAKGYHFARLKLAAVIDGDATGGADFRSMERHLQLLQQVAGRAGREQNNKIINSYPHKDGKDDLDADTKIPNNNKSLISRNSQGRVYIQTWLPEHSLLQALVTQDSKGFQANELVARKKFGWPPFSRLAAVIVSGSNLDQLRSFTVVMRRTLPTNSNIVVLGPAPALISKINNNWRYRFLLIAKRTNNPQLSRQQFWNQWRQQFQIPHSIKVVIDIDPYFFE